MWSVYQRKRAQRDLVNDEGYPREQYLSRTDGGDYVVWAVQAAWGGWKMSRGGL
jgi:hypothetical protein